MVVFDYFSSMGNAVEFLLALGSIVGLLGIVIGFIFLIWGSDRMRGKIVGVIIVSILLLTFCGLNTGIKYFGIFK
ncbi:MAG: hypothetical protein ACFE85_10905 [Candidatus Hodarchaeota archaeon]